MKWARAPSPWSSPEVLVWHRACRRCVGKISKWFTVDALGERCAPQLVILCDGVMSGSAAGWGSAETLNCSRVKRGPADRCGVLHKDNRPIKRLLHPAGSRQVAASTSITGFITVCFKTLKSIILPCVLQLVSTLGEILTIQYLFNCVKD